MVEPSYVALTGLCFDGFFFYNNGIPTGFCGNDRSRPVIT